MVSITILNWDKYNPKSDRTRHKHWFRINQNSAMSGGLFGLSAEQCWVWVQLLAECCRKDSETIDVRPERFAKLCNVTQKTFLEAVEILNENNTLTINRQATDSEPTENRAHITYITNSTDKQTNIVSSELTVVSPRTTSIPIEDFVSNLSEETRKRIEVIYPDQAFVTREVEKMKIWLSNNEKKIPKSKAGWARFIMGWLERGWERYRTSIPSNKPYASGEIDWEKLKREVGA